MDSENRFTAIQKKCAAMIYLDVWRSGTFPEEKQVSEYATDHKHRP